MTRKSPDRPMWRAGESGGVETKSRIWVALSLYLRFISVIVGLAGIPSASAQFTLEADINPGPGGSFPNYFVENESDLYFMTFDPSTSTQTLRRFDGTSVELADANWSVAGVSSNHYLTAYMGVLYFVAANKLYRFDGTSIELLSSDSPTVPSFVYSSNLVTYGGDLCFSGSGGVGLSMWCYSEPEGIATEIPDSDGLGYSYAHVHGSTLFFSASTSASGAELWAYSIVGGPPHQVADINPGALSSRPFALTSYQGGLYFFADDGVHGRELWKFEDNVVSLVADINPDNGSSLPLSTGPPERWMIEHNGRLYFGADDGTHGRELWMFDGTAAKRVEASGRTVSTFAEFGGVLYVNCQQTLCRLHGNTLRPADKATEPVSGSWYPFHITPYQGKLFFQGNEVDNGSELWSFTPTDNYSYLDVRVVLEGPFSASTLSMASGLVGSGLPTTNPYSNPAFVNTLIGYGGSEEVFDFSGPRADVVDWVLIELRSSPHPADSVTTRAALLLSDGSIRDNDGLSELLVEAPPGEYYVVVRHRNHLPIMSATPVPTTLSSPPLYDMTDAENLFGGASAASELAPGVYGLPAGDADANSQVQNTDKNLFFNVQVGTMGYLSGDFDLDGQVQIDGDAVLWRSNAGRGPVIQE